jgi:hypothetical protein
VIKLAVPYVRFALQTSALDLWTALRTDVILCAIEGSTLRNDEIHQSGHLT